MNPPRDVRELMVPPNFYIEFGKAAYAMAMADGKIQMDERRLIKDQINEQLVPLEDRTDQHGANLALSTAFAFETEEPAEHTPEQALERFGAVLQRQNVSIPPKLADEIISIMWHIGKAYGNMDPEEQKILDRFQQLVNAHREG